MASLTTQKQNRALYTTLSVLLVTAVVLSVVTFQADKKDKAPETTQPQVAERSSSSQSETKTNVPQAETKAPSTSTREDTGLFTKEKEEQTEYTTKENTDVQAQETIATAAEPQALPDFCSPIPNGAVLRSHSVTVPVFSPTMNDYRTHTGIDIACTEGEAVQAAADGKIGNFWYDPLMGYTLSVVHTGDAVTLYQGLAEDLPEGIEPGVSVVAGQTIGCVGNTAQIECEDEGHLHFQLDIGGTFVDPVEYLAK